MSLAKRHVRTHVIDDETCQALGVSWLERAIGHRRYFEHTAVGANLDDFRDGTKLVHRWIQMIIGPSVEWGARILCDLDAKMDHGHHDGASGWGMFRNDLTSWLAMAVWDRAKPSDRPHLVEVATCCERYLTAIGGTHAETTAPVCRKWRAVLAGEGSFDDFIAEARAVRELRTLGAGGVLPLIEASRRVIDDVAPPPLSTASMPLAKRSGERLTAPIVLRLWPRDGGEQAKRFDLVESISIGRADTADIRVHDDCCARAHARIFSDGDRLAIADLRSDNQTFLFETAIEQTHLENNDVIVIGRTLILCERAE